MSRSVRVALLWGVSALSLPIRSAADPVDVANPPQGRFIDEWATVHLGGKKAGYYHSTVARDGNMIRTAADMHMRLGRVDMPVTISTQQSTLETLAGAPVEFTSTLDMATMKTATKGTFKDGKVTLVHTQYGMEQTQTYEINPASLMTWGMLRESLVRGFKPGTTYTMKVYAPDLCQHRAIDTVTTVGEWEPVHNAGTSLRGQRITTLMESPVGNLEFVAWIDKDANTLAARLPLPGLGNLEMIRVDESVALADFVAPDLFTSTAIKVTRRIEVESAQRIKYRLRAKSADIQLGTLPDTGMQTVLTTEDGAREIVVVRQDHTPLTGDSRDATPQRMSEYLGGNLMINTADPQLVQLAKRAGGSIDQPFALADRLRRFVTGYVVNKNLNVGFATASEVCRTKQGDCSEHAVLLAALGRLRGFPTRVAVGLAYVPQMGALTNVFGYHMWAQFFIKGKWIDLDAALGETRCSPTRIAFATSSLRDAGLADLSLPLLSKIGGITIEVLEIE